MDAMTFAGTVRRLSEAARAFELEVPSFRSPPRGGVNRSMRRRANGSTVIAVRLRDRDPLAVFEDMVDGLLAVNDRAFDHQLRGRLLAVLAPTDG